MLNASNSLSFIRAPLAFLFLQESTALRIAAILLAMITDSIDGYLARRSRCVSRFGAILDPTMDKFFVYFAMTVFFLEHKLGPWEMAAMLSRDISLCLYGLFMLVTKRWKTIVFRAIRWGKATTALQFLVLIALVLGFPLPWYILALFVAMGWLAFLELLSFSPSGYKSSG